MTRLRQWSRSRRRRILLTPRMRNWFGLGLEDPKPANSSSLPPAERREWEEAYKHAKRVYQSGDEGIPNLDEVSRRAAWRSVEMNDGLRWPNPRSIPPRVDCVVLGQFLEYGYVDEDGVLQVATFGEPDPPELLWDDRRKMLLCFPDLHDLGDIVTIVSRPSVGVSVNRYTSCGSIPQSLRESAAVFKRWSKRDPRCYSEVVVPDYEVEPVGIMDSTSYRSDKWGEADPTEGMSESQSYFHAHGDGVWIYETREENDRGEPRAFFAGGGKLDMRREGLIH